MLLKPSNPPKLKFVQNLLNKSSTFLLSINLQIVNYVTSCEEKNPGPNFNQSKYANNYNTLISIHKENFVFLDSTYMYLRTFTFCLNGRIICHEMLCGSKIWKHLLCVHVKASMHISIRTK